MRKRSFQKIKGSRGKPTTEKSIKNRKSILLVGTENDVYN